VTVSGEKTKVFYDVENSNIIDYYPYQGLCLFITKEKGKRYIQLNSNSKVISKNLLHFVPHSIFLDGFGNFHLVSADSAYQIWFNGDNIDWLPPISYSAFEAQIKPIIGKTDQGVFVQMFKSINKR